MSLRMGALFAGYEGLGLGVADVLDVELTWVSEIEDAPSWILAHHYPHVPNHGDITQIDWTQVEPVDVLTGGFPCQDVSAAGKRAGMREGTRSGLWARMAEAIDHLRPRLVVAENVRGLLSAEADSPVERCPWCVGDGPDSGLRALGAVLGDLADLGYDARWCGLRAADIGAPHGRFRVFVVAWPADAEGDSWRVGNGDGRSIADSDDLGQQRGRGTRRRRQGSTDGSVPTADTAGVRGGALRSAGGEPHGADGPCGERERAPAHTAGNGRYEGRPESTRLERGHDAAERGATAADAEHGGRPGRAPVAVREEVGRAAAAGSGSGDIAWGPYEPAIRRWEHVLGRHAPAPTEPGRTGKPRLSPRFVEWLMGLDDGWVTAVPDISRNDQLKALGNGVVPQQASEALRRLLADQVQGVAA